MSEQTSDRRPGRSWYFFLDDMVVFAKDFLRYTAGMDQPAFESDGLVFDATLRKLELIGEAARWERRPRRDLWKRRLRRMHRPLNPPPARPLKRLQRRPKRRCSE